MFSVLVNNHENVNEESHKIFLCIGKNDAKTLGRILLKISERDSNDNKEWIFTSEEWGGAELIRHPYQKNDQRSANYFSIIYDSQFDGTEPI